MSSGKGSSSVNGDLTQRDKRSALDHMMQECTNRIAKEKFQTQTFQRKSLGTKVQPGPHFLPSGITSFASNSTKPLKATGFPSWCTPDQVPALYRHIENYTTSNGTHEIENGLLLPVLMSSGLQRELLGLIWEMTNKAVPGVLTKEELYATLAIVALFQAGYPVQSIETLHLLPCPPVPVLRFPALMPQVPVVEQTVQSPSAHESVAPQTVLPHFPMASQNFSQQPPISIESQAAPTVIQPDSSSSVTTSFLQPTSRLINVFPQQSMVHPSYVSSSLNATTSSFQQTGNQPSYFIQNGVKVDSGMSTSTKHSEDDFADFQSSCAPMQLPQSTSDDFDDFKQADMSLPSATVNVEITKTASSPASSPFQISSTSSLITNSQSSQVTGASKPTFNIMHNDVGDKYAVFKDISLIAPASSKPIPNNNAVVGITDTISTVEPSISDEFGDFLCADVSPETRPSDTVYEEFQFEFTQASTNSQHVPDEALSNLTHFTQSNHLTLGLKTFSDKGSVNSLESPVYLYESDNLDALSISSFHQSPSRNRKTYNEDDISFDKISMGQPGGDGSNEHSATFSTSSHESSSTETGEHVDFDSTSVNAVSVTDRYSYIKSQNPVCVDKAVTEWLRCLEKCKDTLDEGKSTFYFACNELSHESLEELFETDEIGDYLENITEIFCIVRRIYASSLASGRYTGSIQVALTENDLIWEELSGGISTFYKLPEKMKLDFSSAVLSPTTETHNKLCGVCLLDVDANCGIFSEESVKLTYGARQYHASCANFWVNCVDFLLPALQNAELL